MKAAITLFTTALLMVVFIGVSQGDARAEPLQDGLKGPPMAEIEVKVIFARRAAEKKVDPKLKRLNRYFDRFPGYNWFQQVSSKRLTIPLGDSVALNVPGNRLLKLKYRGVSRGFVKLRFELGDMHMNVRVHNGGVFFHSGYNHEDGRLLLAIRPSAKQRKVIPTGPKPRKEIRIDSGVKHPSLRKPVTVTPRPKIKVRPKKTK